MKNEEAIMQMRVKLMRNRQIGTTGRKMMWHDVDGNEIEIDEPAEIHTYAGWKKLGYQVPTGTRARIFIPIWNSITLGDGSTSMMQSNRAFFTPEQVQRIEEEVENVLEVPNAGVMEELKDMAIN